MNKHSDLSLRSFLSQTFVVYMKTYALHWNYHGPKFYSVHRLTEMQYENLAEAIDEIAERMRALGNVAPVSLVEILEHSSIKEFKGQADNEQSVNELMEAHRALSLAAKNVAEVSQKNNDIFTHDLLIARSGVHDKFAWMLESLIH